ncbi:hypothetical protein M2459_001901 [Parabacteroides sp. PF5-5]|uniref:vitamin B12 dependent-methionine synthase activation domain-containing protein n=1 Tax=unclassified Parabacteroides TaxID=2649774 RepID=UPI0024749D97|nr:MULTISPECIES: vitamin B12 dependent-methionine synthase activation domain-containing protein [unclassified Parabacteroides]MDH6305448.1 hypothetical protein [Parabacteroides sp. PH5-39]MDH6316158.1 hypothetical protein [Parabacteroides sp. PF5-13]MDH6320308.1 hypothetical protein [Parabacteroides sp. PH5-13]MDH6324038.1 hypothetical protein [Parabacteroides sp. PH5-8]MDH6327349.1 hypothetical protein [Parabacteroides sp. PH5-41]
MIPFKRLNIESKHIYEAMGYTPDRFPDAAITELVEELMVQSANYCQPAYSYVAFNGRTNTSGFHIDPYRFKTGKTIAKGLETCEQFVLFVVTAGNEFQEWAKQYQTDIMAHFVVDSIGSVIAEAIAHYMQEEISLNYSQKGLNCTNRYSPGYCGWNIAEQQQLFSLLEGKTCNVRLTASNLMLPVKSVSGVIGVGKHAVRMEYGCSICFNVSCFKRKVVK